jgi:hypothetical protein
MNRLSYQLILLIFALSGHLAGQAPIEVVHDSIFLKGQLSAWENYNPANTFPSQSGLRYIPQLSYEIHLPGEKLIDLEASVNMLGNVGVHPFDSLHASGLMKPYRLWLRYSSHQFELRAGLQKINFGSASLLRPLMWFDQIDPRDPLQLTDGVWGVLARYYFLNNANLWFWGLYGSDKPRGWEILKSNRRSPEFGGRIQCPVPRGEAGLSFHHRLADSSGIRIPGFQNGQIPENRLGLDAKFDLVIGCWFEASWISRRNNIGILTNEEILNLGADYTFGVGNGLNLTFEQLLSAADEKAFRFSRPISFSLLSMGYPIGMFDNLSAIIYYDWTNKATYNFINWQKQFNKFSVYLMGYFNPVKYNIPARGAGENLYAGKGLQLMLVYNH